MERKISSPPWAFTEDEKEKGKTNNQIYLDNLKPKSKQFWGNEQPTEEDLKNFMCYKHVGSGYAHSKYKVLSNPFKFSLQEQALICDDGNLCFGYRIESGLIVIYTD